jgi:hypothetical protein
MKVFRSRRRLEWNVQSRTTTESRYVAGSETPQHETRALSGVKRSRVRGNPLTIEYKSLHLFNMVPFTSKSIFIDAIFEVKSIINNVLVRPCV